HVSYPYPLNLFYQVDGVESMSVADVGVVVDAEFGLVVVDRTTVQVALGDVMLTFNGSEVRGSVLRSMHAQHKHA
ncbi:unnamed protein product, partial [Laminaria digitata]